MVLLLLLLPSSLLLFTVRTSSTTAAYLILTRKQLIELFGFGTVKPKTHDRGGALLRIPLSYLKQSRQTDRLAVCVFHEIADNERYVLALQHQCSTATAVKEGRRAHSRKAYIYIYNLNDPVLSGHFFDDRCRY